MIARAREVVRRAVLYAARPALAALVILALVTANGLGWLDAEP